MPIGNYGPGTGYRPPQQQQPGAPEVGTPGQLGVSDFQPAQVQQGGWTPFANYLYGYQQGGSTTNSPFTPPTGAPQVPDPVGSPSGGIGPPGGGRGTGPTGHPYDAFLYKRPLSEQTPPPEGGVANSVQTQYTSTNPFEQALANARPTVNTQNYLFGAPPTQRSPGYSAPPGTPGVPGHPGTAPPGQPGNKRPAFHSYLGY